MDESIRFKNCNIRTFGTPKIHTIKTGVVDRVVIMKDTIMDICALTACYDWKDLFVTYLVGNIRMVPSILPTPTPFDFQKK